MLSLIHICDESGIFPVVTKTGIQMISLNLLVEDETTPVV